MLLWTEHRKMLGKLIRNRFEFKIDKKEEIIEIYGDIKITIMKVYYVSLLGNRYPRYSVIIEHGSYKKEKVFNSLLGALRFVMKKLGIEKGVLDLYLN